MPTIDAHTQGSFCWSELVTSDVDASLVFYGALFDWIPEEADLVLVDAPCSGTGRLRREPSESKQVT